jgi:hypothetical protein
MTQFPSPQPEGGVLNSSPEVPHDTPSKSRVLNFIIIAVSAVVLLFACAVVWEAFFSPRAVGERETRKNYEQAVKGMKEFEDKMTADTYGGRTPQETLDMFIAALEKDDIDLAVKYFSSLNNSDSEAIGNELKNKTDADISELLSILKELRNNQRKESEDSVLFFKKNNKGEIEYSVLMIKNKFSGVWKIESM